MISCDECQKKIVAVFDNEGGEGDEELISAHLKQCHNCRAFQGDMVRIRQQFVSVPMPTPPLHVGRQIMQIAQADRQQSEYSQDAKSARRQPFLVRFPRLASAGGIAAMFLIAASWLVCFILAREVGDLRQELEVARQDGAVAQAEKQVQEAREREQKAIAALYFRMQELEERIDRSPSARTTFLPAQLKGPSDGPGEM